MDQVIASPFQSCEDDPTSCDDDLMDNVSLWSYHFFAAFKGTPIKGVLHGPHAICRCQLLPVRCLFRLWPKKLVVYSEFFFFSWLNILIESRHFRDEHIYKIYTGLAIPP